MEREDMYEAAVRAVLDLCDKAAEEERMLDYRDVRKVIRDALMIENEGDMP
jgi:hypothetical protein